MLISNHSFIRKRASRGEMTGQALALEKSRDICTEPRSVIVARIINNGPMDCLRGIAVRAGGKLSAKLTERGCRARRGRL